MTNDRTCLDLSRQQIDVIESALRTQEKILSVQSRAGSDGTIRARLDELKDVLKRLDRQAAARPQSQCSGWGGLARSLFG